MIYCEILNSILEKGCMSYNQFLSSDFDKKLIFDLIDNNILHLVDLDSFTYLAPNLLKAKDFLSNIEDTKYSSHLEKLINNLIYRRESFLTFMYSNIAVTKDSILNHFNESDLVISHNLLDIRDFKDLVLYSLNPLGCKYINKMYSSDKIICNILKTLSLSNITNNNQVTFNNILNILNTTLEYQIIDLSKLITLTSKNSLNEALDLNLLDFKFFKSKSMCILSKKGFDIINRSKKSYNDYLSEIHLKTSTDYSDELLSANCNNLIKSLLKNTILKKSSISSDSCSELFIKMYTHSFIFLEEDYICLNNKFTQNYCPKTKNPLKESTFKKLLKLYSSANLSDGISTLSSCEKQNLLNAFNFTYTKGATPKLYGLKPLYLIDINKIKSFNLLITFVKAHKLGYIKVKSLNSSIFVSLTPLGYEYFKIKPSKFSVNDLINIHLSKDSYRLLLNDIYHKKLLSKEYAEKLYSKTLIKNIAQYIELFFVNSKAYISLNKEGFRLIKKPPYKFAMEFNCDNILLGDFVLDIADFTILKTIYNSIGFKQSILKSFLKDRYLKFIKLNLIELIPKSPYIRVSKKGCSLISSSYEDVNQIPFKTNLKCYTEVAFDKLSKLSLAENIVASLSNLENNAIHLETQHLLSICKNILNNTNNKNSLSKKNNLLQVFEEDILLRLYKNKVYLLASSLPQPTLDKLKKFKLIKRCTNTFYIKLTEKGLNLSCTLSKFRQFVNIPKEHNSNSTKLMAKLSFSDVYKTQKINTNLLNWDDIENNTNNYNLIKISSYNISSYIDFLKKGNYIIFDTEFGMKTPKKSSLFEVSALKISNSKIIDKFTFLISDNHSKLTGYISKLTNITKDMLRLEGVDENFVTKDFINFIGNLPVLAHNIYADWTRILASCYKFNIPVPKNQLIDTISIFSSIYPKENHGLDKLIEKFNIKSESIPRHRAFGDCIYTFNALSKALDSEEASIIKFKNPSNSLKLVI